MPRWVGEKPAWMGRPLLSYLSVGDWALSRVNCPQENGLPGATFLSDRATLIAAGGFSASLGRVGSRATLLSNDDPEAIDRKRVLGKSAIYAPKAVVEHVIPPERPTQSWFRRRAAWQAVSDLLKEPEEAPALSAAARCVGQAQSALSDRDGLFAAWAREGS